MTDLSRIKDDRQVDVAEAERMTASWPALLTSPIESREQCLSVKAAIDDLTAPPERAWVMARIAALLSQYYAADVPQSIVTMMAEDWQAAIGRYPQWCIAKSVRWWKSADNPDRKRRPLEGDIEAVCKREFGVVQVARLAVRNFENGGDRSPMGQVERTEPTEESRRRIAQIVAEAGFAKRMDAAE